MRLAQSAAWPLMASTDTVHGVCGGQVESGVRRGSNARDGSLADDHCSPATRPGMLAALDELLSLAAALVADRTHRNLAAARARVAEDRFNLVVLGEFKRGKSSLINALLGRDVLPIGVVPLTSVVTAIGAGESDRLIVHYSDGREQEQPIDRAGRVRDRGPESRQQPWRRVRARRARS